MKRTKTPIINIKKQQLAIEALGSDSFLSINKKLLSAYGPELSVYIGNIIDKYKYFMNKDQLAEDGSFFLTYDDQKIHTGMSEYQLRKCKNKLKDMGVLHTDMRGLPPKEFYLLDLCKLVDEFLMNIPLKTKGINLKKLKDNAFENLSNNKETKYNKDNRDKESVSKDTYAPAEHLEECHEIIFHWNSLPKVTKHTKPDTKVYQTCCQFIGNLLSGSPLVQRKDKTPTLPFANFMDKFKINSGLLHKQWTADEIKQILTTIQERDPVQRSLSAIFWNNQSQLSKIFSYFMFEASKKQIDAKYVGLARKLAKILNPELPRDKIYAWAKEFESLVEEEKENVNEIKTLIIWYGNNIHDKYTPQAEHAAEFVDKYNKIKRAKARKEQDKDKPSQTVTIGTRSASDYQPNPEFEKLRYGHETL